MSEKRTIMYNIYLCSERAHTIHCKNRFDRGKNYTFSTNCCSVFEFLLKSDIVNCQHSMSDLMCTSYAQKAALWHMYGRR